MLLTCVSAGAIWYHLTHGYILYLGDAVAHLNIARRILDARQTGPHQIGTGWLPLLHLLIMPFATVDAWWRSGLAGAIPAGASFVVAGTFLFAAARRIFGSPMPAVAATLLFAANPNILYLQATPLTEPVFFAALMAILYATVWYAQSSSLWALLLAAAASNAASLTRYDGWFLIPFLAIFFSLAGKPRRWLGGVWFGALAALGPLAWLAHNWWYYGNVLEFYSGPYSTMAIYQRQLAQGMDRYPGDHEWGKAWTQFTAAAQLCAGGALTVLGLAGLLSALWKKAFWPVAFLTLPIAFYVYSIHSAGAPIYVPHLWPNSYYNLRYGAAAFPLLVLCAGSLVAILPGRLQGTGMALVVLVGVVPWMAYPRPDAWVCWKEAEVNHAGRRAYTREAAEYLKPRYHPGEGIYSTFGDITGIYQEAGIRLRETLDDGSHPEFNAVEQRPDLFLHEEWAVAISGDTVSSAILKDSRRGERYVCEKIIMVKGAPVIEIYRRNSVHHGDSLHQSPRGQE